MNLNEIIELYQSMSLVINSIALAITLFSIVTMWIVFKKAGTGGWKILIPIYNVYTRYKIARAVKRFWFSLLLTVAAFVVGGFALGDILYDLHLDIGGFFITDKIVICSAVAGLLLLIVAIMGISVNFSLAKAFGLSGLFGLGLWLLPTIFHAIIAFNSNIRYTARKRPAFLK